MRRPFECELPKAVSAAVNRWTSCCALPSSIFNSPTTPDLFAIGLKETRGERKAETKQVERLSAVLAKKASSAKAKGLPERGRVQELAFSPTGPDPDSFPATWSSTMN